MTERENQWKYSEQWWSVRKQEIKIKECMREASNKKVKKMKMKMKASHSALVSCF